MKIGLVGGLTRSESQLNRIAAEAGHELLFHNGKIRGNGAAALRRNIERSDFVIILTSINSHQAVWIAKKALRENDRPAIVMSKCGPDAFRDVIQAIERSAINQFSWLHSSAIRNDQVSSLIG